MPQNKQLAINWHVNRSFHDIFYFLPATFLFFIAYFNIKQEKINNCNFFFIKQLKLFLQIP